MLKETLENEELRVQTFQLQTALHHTLKVALGELRERSDLSQAKVQSYEDQLEKLGSRSWHILEEAGTVNQDLKSQSGEYQLEAEPRAEHIDQVEKTAQKEFSARRHHAELEQQTAQKAVSEASLRTQEASSSKEHFQTLH